MSTQLSKALWGLFGSLGVSTFGDGLLFVVVPLWVLSLTGEPWSVGLTFAVQALARVVLSPFAGAWADRGNRRTLLMGTLLVRAAVIASLLFVSDSNHVAWIYVALSLEACASTLGRPAAFALVPAVVPTANLIAANGRLGSVYSLAQLGSPFVGTAIYAAVGAKSVVALATVAYLTAALALLAVPTSIGRGGEPQGEKPLALIRDGFRKIWRSPVLRGLLWATAGMWIAQGALLAVAVPWLDTFTGGSKQAFGWLVASQGLGMMLGGLTVGELHSRVPQPTLLLAVFLLGGVACASLGIQTQLWGVLIVIGVFGFLYLIASASVDGMMQRHTPRALLGRVESAQGVTAESMRLLGLSVASLFVVQLGYTGIFIFCGVMHGISVLGTWHATHNDSQLPTAKEEGISTD